MEQIILGKFNGREMIGEDGSIYPVPDNYASKSRMIEGDKLKLTINGTGEFLYKQIQPMPRKRVIGIFVESEENNSLEVQFEDKRYKILTASLSFFKPIVNDQAVILIPAKGQSTYAALDNVIKPPKPSINNNPVVNTTKAKAYFDDEAEF